MPVFIRPRFDISDLTGFSSRDDISSNARDAVKNARTSESRAYFQFYALQNAVRKNAYCECCIRNNARLGSDRARVCRIQKGSIDHTLAKVSIVSNRNSFDCNPVEYIFWVH